MKSHYILTNRIILGLGGLFCLANLASADPLEVGSEILVDFGSVGGTTTNYNNVGRGATNLSTVINSNGQAVDRVGFSYNALRGQANDPILSPVINFANTAQQDWVYNVSPASFMFSGLDDSFVYELIVGSYRPSATATQARNANTSWQIGGKVLSTDVTDPSDSYVKFTSLVPVNGTLVINTIPEEDGNDTMTVSAMSLRVVGTVNVLLNEDASGIDIPDSEGFTTPLGDTEAGVNTVSGTINENGIFDPDVFSFRVPAGQQLTSFSIDGLSSTGAGHFLMFNDGRNLDADSTNGIEALFATLVDDSNVGENLLATLGGNDFNASKILTLPLEPGEYSVWFQETDTSAIVDYTFNFTTEAVEVPQPVARWNFNQGNGTVATDISGNNHDGVVRNGTWVEGGLDFNGSNADVEIPADLFDGFSTEISVAMWILGDDTQPRQDSLFYAENAAGIRVLNIHLPWKNSQVYWDAGLGADNKFDRINLPSDQENFKGEWNHWVFTKNATSGEMAIYVNGELFHLGTGYTNLIEGISSATIGSGIGQLFYDGTIDDFAIYDEALSAGEVGRLFTIESSITPVAQWEFNEAQGTVATDSSGNGHDGVITNGTWVQGGLDFNGSNGSVEIPADLFNGIENQISVAMWIVGDQLQPRADSLFYAENAAGNRVLNIHLPWKNSQVYWDAGLNNSNKFDRIDLASKPENYRGQLNHWVFTKDASTGVMAIYVNGEFFHSEGGNTSPISGITVARLGSAINQLFYDGTIDSFSIYDVALNASEVSQLFKDTRPDENVGDDPITGLTAVPNGATSAELAWETVAGYTGGVLISQATAGGGFEIIAYVPPGNNTFTVENLIPGEEVSFSVTPVGSGFVGTAVTSNSVIPDLGNDGAVLVRFTNLGGDGQQRRFDFFVENSTQNAIPINQLTLRYWSERESEDPINARMDNNRIIPSNGGFIGVTQATNTEEFQAVTSQEGADTFFDITFDSDAVLPAGTVNSPSRLILNGAFFRNFAIQNSFVSENDYSFLPDADQTVNNRLNLLRNGELIFGVEPGGGAGGTGRPADPAALVALPSSADSIELNWVDNANNETIYIIERDFDEDAEGFKIITTVGANTVSYIDSNLLDQAGYSYRVRAVNANGVSSTTNIATAETFEGTTPKFIPVAPTNVTVTPFSSGRLDINWTDVSRNENGFIVERQLGNGGYVEIGRTNPGETFFFDFGLESNTAYIYRVSAFNLAGNAETVSSAVSTLSPLPGGAPTDAEISRFLRQATFGATPEMVAEVRELGFEGWLDRQFSLPASSHFSLTQQLGGAAATQADRTEAWWQITLDSPDQARQRLAFALSQILVVSLNDGDLSPQALGMANYYDLLVAAPEKGYRQLLEDVTFSPVMGNYLDHTRNQKTNVETGVRPDENYAREIMQLFSIGLWQLNLDGSRKTDGNGNGLPTYNQRDIEQVARVFTGLTFATADPNDEISYFLSPEDYMNPMIVFPAFHETGSKDFDLLNSDFADLPANTSNPSLDFTRFLNRLANHSSVAPFICRQLIQRTITSNPSPAYIQRVSEVFVNNGSGVRGDLGAVFKAILLDEEARSADPLDSPTYGKQREPIIRYATLLRGLGADPGTAGSGIVGLTSIIGQEPLAAASVFNFYEPDYSHPGAIANLGLVSPEFQITQSSTALMTANFIDNQLFADFGNLNLDFARYSTLSDAAMLDKLNIDFMDGRMPSAMRAIIEEFISDLTAEQKVRSALYLIHTASEYTIEQ